MAMTSSEREVQSRQVGSDGGMGVSLRFDASPAPTTGGWCCLLEEESAENRTVFCRGVWGVSPQPPIYLPPLLKERGLRG
jgi:hypothetical protein